MKATAAVLLSLFSLAAGAAAADSNWGSWRGPELNGTSPDAKPPVSWSEKEHVKWKYEIPGSGTSSPVVWGDSVFLTTAVGTGKKADSSPAAPPAGGGSGGGGLPPPRPGGLQQGQTPQPESAPPGAPGGGPPGEGRRGRRGGGGFGRGEAPSEVQQFVVLCLDRATGKERWRKAAREILPHEGHHQDHGYASASCITDGEHVFAFFGSRGIFCFDMQGNAKWDKDLGDMRTRAGFGEGASPALHGGTLVVNWDHEGEDFIVAFEKATGKEIWRKSRDEITTWTTPLIVEYGGKTQVIVCATNRIRSYDLANGDELWQCGGMTDNVIPSPVAGFDMVYAISGFRGAALRAIKLGRTGDLTDTSAVAWKHDDRTPYVPSPLLVGERLYFYSGNNAMLSCLDAKTGTAHYAVERVPGMSGVYASPVAAGGRIYLAGREGTTVVLKDGPKLEVLATNKLDEKFDATPAIAGNQLFLRGHKHLYCLAE